MSLKYCFKGKIFHKRFLPTTHQFTYFHTLFHFDITEHSSESPLFFSYNKFNLFSIYNQDYLNPGNKSLWEKTQNILKINKCHPADKINLYTNPKFLSFTFNPLSLFFCYSNGEKNPHTVIAEVHNTFKQKHLYILKNNEKKETKLNFKHQKQFHVSPFFTKEGEYHFELENTSQTFRCRIDYFHQKDLLLRAEFNGDKNKISAINLLQVALISGYHIASPMIKILNQAYKLHFLKKLPIYKKPYLSNPNSFNSRKATMIEKMCMFFVFKWLKTLVIGKLQIKLPDGSVKNFGKTEDHLVNINVLDYNFFKSVAWQASLGFAHAYLNNQCEVSSIKELFSLFLKNKKTLQSNSGLFSNLGLFFANLSHLRNKNTLQNSKNNIQAHYDLGNSFFNLFLDETKLYSAAIFKKQDDSLLSAQQTKATKLIDLLQIKNSDSHILEIGSGWGFIACEIAKRVGCKVTTITLSKEQKKYIENKIKQENLSHLVRVKLLDYRHLNQKYDGIISIEMIEAIGKEYLDEYFKICGKNLKKGGNFVLQAITMSRENYSAYLKNKDFIQEYIFPGGHLFPKELLTSTAEKYNLFEISSDSIGQHYAQTLRCWEENFIQNIDSIRAQGFDEKFIKTWLYYFNYCEAGFNTEYIDNYQISYKKN